MKKKKAYEKTERFYWKPRKTERLFKKPKKPDIDKDIDIDKKYETDFDVEKENGVHIKFVEKCRKEILTFFWIDWNGIVLIFDLWYKVL